MLAAMKKPRNIPWERIVSLGGGVFLLAFGVFGPGWAYLETLDRYRVSVTPGGTIATTADRNTSIRHPRYIATAVKDFGTIDLYAVGASGGAVHIAAFPMTEALKERDDGYFTLAANGHLRDAVRRKGDPAAPDIPTAMIGAGFAEHIRATPENGLRFIMVETDGRLDPRRNEKSATTLSNELQASLARLPIPSSRWKAVLAER